MRKSILLSLLSITICLIFAVIGYHLYQQKINAIQSKSKIEMDAYNRQQSKDAAEKKAKTIAEQKAVFKKHNGKPLIYIPMGDSLAEGWYASSPSKDYVNLLSSLIHKNIGYDVEAKGFAFKAGTGLKDEGLPLLNNVINSDPDFVTVEFGTNDLQSKIRNAYSTPTEFESRLSTLIKGLQSAPSHPKIILVTTWNGGLASQTYDNIIYTVGKKYKVPVADISPVWANRTDTMGPKGSSSFAGTGVSDGWHPNDKGHAEIAQIIYKQSYSALK